jgi:TPR repeat protein
MRTSRLYPYRVAPRLKTQFRRASNQHLRGLKLLPEIEGAFMKPNFNRAVWGLVTLATIAFTPLPAMAGPSEDKMVLANAAYLDQKYDAAFEIWQPLADGGNMQAQMELANALLHCDCTPKGTELAMKYYRMAGAQKNVEAVFQLAEIHAVRLRDKAEAARYYKLAADNGHIEAQVDLADIYQSGLTGPEKQALAPKYYLLAAAQGDKAAYSRLGYLYENAKLVPQDLGRAYLAYSVAAAQFFPMAKEDVKKLEPKMTAKQLIAAKILFKKCVKAKYLNCL